ncbi:MAG TPA: DUF3667 domain-containing protein [Flavobacteriaceae bacterium]|nr:DUF3667 domain-containing protein [Flavobacteriaceae bacterium]
MSNRKLRTERNCLNCGAYVEERFCPHCGQENVINRPSFYFLFTTFLKDLVNYDSNFWKTITTLFLKPGSIVNQYLAGKRKSFVNPIKLYFFISLFTFFLPSILFYFDRNKESLIEKEQGYHSQFSITPESEDSSYSDQNALTKRVLPDSVYVSNDQYIDQSENLDSTSKESKEFDFPDSRMFSFGDNPYYSKAENIREFDSIHRSLPKENRMNWIIKLLYRKDLELDERGMISDDEFRERFATSFKSNFPRVLILYLPIFAFILWIFHGKRRWKYYDHGVFTLYYFSFLLLLTSLIMLFDRLLSTAQSLFFILPNVTNKIATIIYLIGSVYAVFYFFRCHRRIYKESKFISRLKSLLILGVNFWLFLFSLLTFTIITFLMI